MANESAKKIVKRNAAIIRSHTIATGVFLALQLLFSWIWEGSYLGIITGIILDVACMGFLKAQATPTYDAGNNLINPGTDLYQKGIIEFVFDILYCAWICQFFTILSGWLWLLMVLIVGIHIYKFINVARSLGGMGQPQAAEEDEKVKRSRATKTK